MWSIVINAMKKTLYNKSKSPLLQNFTNYKKDFGELNDSYQNITN